MTTIHRLSEARRPARAPRRPATNVKLDRTSSAVATEGRTTSSSTPDGGQGVVCDRSVKYAANNPPKNTSSDARKTIVPNRMGAISRGPMPIAAGA